MGEPAYGVKPQVALELALAIKAQHLRGQVERVQCHVSDDDTNKAVEIMALDVFIDLLSGGYLLPAGMERIQERMTWTEEWLATQQLDDDEPPEGWQVNHDALGWYIAAPGETEPESGASLGFDGRPHFADWDEALTECKKLAEGGKGNAQDLPESA